MNKLLKSFKAAELNGVKKPALRVGEYRLNLAPSTGNNPDHIYIKDSDYSYLGKITPAGGVIWSIKAQDRRVGGTGLLLDTVYNPEGVITSQGKETGICSCCGRELTNPLSVKLGIGPICRGYWFLDSPTDEEIADTQQDLLDSIGLGEDENLYTSPLDSLGESGDTFKDNLEVLGSLSSTIQAAVDKSKEESKLEINDILAAYTRLDTESKIELLSRISIHEVIAQ